MNAVLNVETVCVVAVAVALNVVLPMVVRPFATETQVNPPNGAENLSLVDQVMHMLVHHAQVPLTSSLIVALIVVLALVLGKRLKKML